MMMTSSSRRTGTASKTTTTKSATTTGTTTNNNYNNNNNMLRFDDGAIQFRLRIVVSILSCQSLLIRNIRSDSITDPGLTSYEISFLRLIDSITNGTKIEINATGTQLKFIPGILTGGIINHNCPIGTDENTNDTSDNTNNTRNNIDNDSDTKLSYRSIGWFLEGILPLAPFGKEPLHIKFNGITDGTCHIDPSCDYFQSTIIPIMMNQFHIGLSKDGVNDKDFMGPIKPYIKIIRRGAAPTGGGYVEFYCPIITKELSNINYIDVGKFKRIRGTAISTKIVSSSTTARVAYSAKGLLHRLIPDVWVYTDVHTISKHQCGISPSVTLILSAVSTTGVIISSESCLNVGQTNTNTNSNYEKELPEDLGIRCAAQLLNEIQQGGCINNSTDSSIVSIILLWMCLTSEDVNRIRIGSLTPYTIQSLRLYKQVLGVEFKIKPDIETKTILLSCLGIGYRNMARAST